MDYDLEELNLFLPCSSHENAWKDIIKEYIESGEEPYPYGLHLDVDINEFHKYLNKDSKNRKKRFFSPSFVPSTTYFLMNGNQSQIIGSVNIRSEINKDYMQVGGHISYSVRPSFRKLGYANFMLKLALEKCRQANLSKALLTCYKENIASASVIKYNGGKLENTIFDSSGELIERYWIML